MVRIKLTNLKCLRCNHKWIPKKTEVRICPKCKSPYWDKPRTLITNKKGKPAAANKADMGVVKEAVKKTFEEYGEVIRKLGKE